MNSPASPLSLNEAITVDVREVVRRVRKYKFGRLSNRRIVERVRVIATPEDVRGISDDELLARWFQAFDREFAKQP